MAKKTILITGGTGMVGRNILEHPKIGDWEVHSPTSNELNLESDNAVEHYFLHFKPDAVVHAAGYVGGIQANIEQPVAFLEKNIAINRNIIMKSFQHGVKNFINLASTCMYPRHAPNPLVETDILTGELEPTNEGYALAKIFATRLCEYIRRENRDFRYKTIIPCNLYGRYDTFDPKRSHLIPAIIAKIHEAKIKKSKTVHIWGDGTARREFMYTADLADAIMKAIADIDNLPDLMNCGLGYDHSITTYYQAVADVIGWDGTFLHDLLKPEGMRQKLCSVDRMSEWGWSAQTSLYDGIKATYDYYIEELKHEN